MRYGLICKILPRHPETEPKYRMHAVLFDTEKEAEDEQRALRVQNLPFTTTVCLIMEKA